MPNPADLPVELFNAVLDLALHDESDTQRLCSLALLGRKWHAALLGRIYNEWAYNGARQPFTTLWKFVRTVRSNARIAALVRILNVGNWGFYPGATVAGGKSPSQVQLPPDERELIRGAIHDSGLGDLEASIFESLSRRDRRPLMAILLTSVPNLSTLYAHVPPSDPILGTFLKRTLDCQTSGKKKSLCSLRELKELYLFHEVPVLVRKHGGSDHEAHETSSSDGDPNDAKLYLRLDYLWPAFYLPSLRTLSLFDLNPEKAAEYLGRHAAVSHVENLYLIGYWGSVFTFPDTQALSTRTERLKSLSLYLQEDVYLSKISNSEIWDCLRKHKDSLETVDIYRDAAVHSDENGHFGLLREFTSLKHLHVQVEMLLGGCCDSPLAPFRLRDTLPSTIQALTLYGSEGYHVIPDLPDQVQELLGGEFPSLRSITLEELDAVAHDDGKPKEPYQRLKEVCAGNGINLQIEKGGQLPKGGSRRELWTKTFYMREDGDRRSMAVSYIPKNLRDSQELLIRSVEDDADSDDDEDEEMSDSEDEYGPHVEGTLKVHAVPFTDHRGKTAYMVFENLESFPLPPLFSFAIYLTHPAVTPESTDMLLGLHQELKSEYGGGDFDVRFDMYFLPSATHEDCISHYRGEKATRGSYLEQVRMFEQCDRDEVHPLPETVSQVPGMVDKYHTANQVLYICSEKDWRAGQRILCVLKFNEQGDTDDATPAFRAEHHRPMTKQSPAYDLENPLNPNNEDPVDGEMFEMAHWDRDSWLGAWQKATSRGWTGWLLEAFSGCN